MDVRAVLRRSGRLPPVGSPLLTAADVVPGWGQADPGPRGNSGVDAQGSTAEMAPAPPAPAPSSGDDAASASGANGRAGGLSIGELEAGYPLYCRALRRLIEEGRSLERIQRTTCWQRLATLHGCLPGQYKDPDYLYLQLRRQINGSRPSPRP